MGIHPVLLDAALHALVLGAESDQLGLPFSWQGVWLHAAGASRVRAHIAPAGEGAVSIQLADTAGLPVLSVPSLTTRPVSVEQLHAAMTAAGGGPDQGLLEITWSPVTVPEIISGSSEHPAVLSWNDFHADLSIANPDGDGAYPDGDVVVVWELGAGGGAAGQDVVRGCTRPPIARWRWCSPGWSRIGRALWW